MENQLPVLVFAQSARFIAELATQAGFAVWVADCYGDTDTLSCADRYLQLPPFPKFKPDQFVNFLNQLSQGEPCYLVCGTGVEKYYLLLEQLPSHIHLLGPSASTIAKLRQPAIFFGLLKQLGIKAPQISYDLPLSTSDWLKKSLSGFGGNHITWSHQAAEHDTPKDAYYQQYIEGKSASACFISNGKQVKILSINNQIHTHDFQLIAIGSPLAIQSPLSQRLQDIVMLICQHTDLIGINSIDFIIKEDDIYVLEVNPRISASAELLQNALFDWHVQACQKSSLKNCIVNDHQSYRLLTYIFAEQDLIIPEQFLWPTTCHDIPVAGTHITGGSPICSMLISHESFEVCQSILSANKTFLLDKLSDRS